MKRFLQIILILVVNIVLAGCSSDLSGNQMDVNSVLKQDIAPNQAGAPGLPSGVANGTLNKPISAKKDAVENSKKEEKVIISINNFGRTNPFSPFEEKIITGDSSIMPLLKDLPPPPTYAPNPNITNLMQTRVNGILYDSVRSSAIITMISKNENGEDVTKDYLVHKGDMIFNYYIKDILADRVVIKYGNNVYTPGIGEIVGEKLDIYPVSGRNRSFGGAQRASSASPSAYNVKIVSPTYTSTLN